MQPALSQACTLSASLEDDIHGFADAAGTAIELWLTKVEDYVKTHSVEELRRLADEREQSLIAASFQGGLLLSQGEARREAWQQFEQRLVLLQQLKVPLLVVTADYLGPFSQVDIERSQVSLKQAGEAAERHGIRLALEFQARNTFINNLETAVSFVESVERPNVGLCLDAFHFSVGSSKTEDLRYLTPQNLFHVQFCDVADRPRELAADSDRILPGEGDFPLTAIIERLTAIGYSGYVSLELLNPLFWGISPRQVGEIGLTALRVALRQNSGGA